MLCVLAMSFMLAHASSMEPAFICDDVVSGQDVTWSAAKQTWCCIHEVKGCEAEVQKSDRELSASSYTQGNVGATNNGQVMGNAAVANDIMTKLVPKDDTAKYYASEVAGIVKAFLALYLIRFVLAVLDSMCLTFCKNAMMLPIVLQLVAFMRLVYVHIANVVIATWAAFFDIIEVFWNHDELDELSRRTDLVWRFVDFEYALLYSVVLWVGCLSKLQVFGGMFSLQDLCNTSYDVAQSVVDSSAKATDPRNAMVPAQFDPAAAKRQFESARDALFPTSMWRLISLLLCPVLTMSSSVIPLLSQFETVASITSCCPSAVTYYLRQEIAFAAIAVFQWAVGHDYCPSMVAATFLFGIPFCITLASAVVIRVSTVLGKGLGWCLANPEWEKMLFNGTMNVKYLMLLVGMIPCGVLYQNGHPQLALLLFALSLVLVEVAMKYGPAYCSPFWNRIAEACLRRCPALPF